MMKLKDEQHLEESRTLIAVGISDPDETYLDYLREIGYILEKRSNPEKLYEQIIAQIPNVLLLDMDTLGNHAIQIAHKLKDNPLTYTMPIIIVVGNRDTEKEIQALEAGAEDFVAKPFLPEVLAARIYTSIRRNIRLQISNPLTGLPGAVYIEEQTTKRLERGASIAMCYADLDNFKAFNDKYGYNRGDNVIRILATILNEGVGMFGTPGDFVGHIGGDDFVMIIDGKNIDEVCSYVTSSFDALIPFQYDVEDMERGYIVSENRQGEKRRFPLMTVSIGIVTTAQQQIDSYLIMTEFAAEMKEYAKSLTKSFVTPKSLYRVDQRAGSKFKG